VSSRDGLTISGCLGERFPTGEHGSRRAHPLALLGALALGNVARDQDDLRDVPAASRMTRFRFDMAEAAVGRGTEFDPPPSPFRPSRGRSLDAIASRVDLLKSPFRWILSSVKTSATTAVVDAPPECDQGDQVAYVFGDQAKRSSLSRSALSAPCSSRRGSSTPCDRLPSTIGLE